MTHNAGVFRTQESLTLQKEILHSLREQFKHIRVEDKSLVFNTELQEALELGHMLDYSAFIVEGALARQESRGAHFRDDYKERDDANWLAHTMAVMNEARTITLEKMGVTLGKFTPEVRSY